MNEHTYARMSNTKTQTHTTAITTIRVLLLRLLSESASNRCAYICNMYRNVCFMCLNVCMLVSKYIHILTVYSLEL